MERLLSDSTGALGTQLDLTVLGRGVQAVAIEAQSEIPGESTSQGRSAVLSRSVNEALCRAYASLFAFLTVWLYSSAAFAATAGTSWGTGPLETITSELSGAAGPLSVICLAAGGLGLMSGRDFGQLAHTASYVAIVAGMVGAASTVFAGGALVG